MLPVLLLFSCKINSFAACSLSINMVLQCWEKYLKEDVMSITKVSDYLNVRLHFVIWCTSALNGEQRFLFSNMLHILEWFVVILILPGGS